VVILHAFVTPFRRARRNQLIRHVDGTLMKMFSKWRWDSIESRYNYPLATLHLCPERVGYMLHMQYNFIVRPTGAKPAEAIAPSRVYLVCASAWARLAFGSSSCRSFGRFSCFAELNALPCLHVMTMT
jgi:hypothetical protein